MSVALEEQRVTYMFRSKKDNQFPDCVAFFSISDWVEVESIRVGILSLVLSAIWVLTKYVLA